MSEVNTSPTEQGAGEDEHEEHPLPKGALVITLSYLLLLTLLWVQVYMQMLNSGGVSR
jgi:hypothetical protein